MPSVRKKEPSKRQKTQRNSKPYRRPIKEICRRFSKSNNAKCADCGQPKVRPNPGIGFDTMEMLWGYNIGLTIKQAFAARRDLAVVVAGVSRSPAEVSVGASRDSEAQVGSGLRPGSGAAFDIASRQPISDANLRSRFRRGRRAYTTPLCPNGRFRSIPGRFQRQKTAGWQPFSPHCWVFDVRRRREIHRT